MEAEGNSKKRRRDSSEENNSFVENIKTRLTDILGKWFGGVDSSKSNGTIENKPENRPEITDSSTDEDDTFEQPPSKRMRIVLDKSQEDFNNLYGITSSRSQQQEPPDDLVTKDTQDGYDTVDQRVQQDLTAPSTSSTDINSPNMHSTPRNTTSVYSGPAARRSISRHKRPPLSRTSANLPDTSQGSVTTSEPSFKPELLNSPFYFGVTKYGGASSNFTNIHNVTVQDRSNVQDSDPSANGTLSNRSLRIMDILESYSSPINDAKRLPPMLAIKSSSSFSFPTNTFPTSKNRELFISTMPTLLKIKQRSRIMQCTKAARQIAASVSSNIDLMTNPQRCFDNTSVKTNAQIPKSTEPENVEESLSSTEVSTGIEEKDTDNNECVISKSFYDDTNAKRDTADIVDSLSGVQEMDSANNEPASSDSYPNTKSHLKGHTGVQIRRDLETTETVASEIDDNDFDSSHINLNSKYTSKIKRNLSRQQRGITENIEETLVPLDLPKGVLNIDPNNLPKFSMNTTVSPKPLTNSLYNSTSSVTESKPFTEASEDSSSCSSYTFSFPIRLPGENDDPNTSLSFKNYVFDSPKRNLTLDSSMEDEGQETIDEPNVATPQKSPTTVTKIHTTESKTWQCSECWVNNQFKDETCVCCNAKKESHEPTSNPISDINYSNDNNWKYDECWVSNSASSVKCVCCGAAGGAAPSKLVPENNGGSCWNCDCCGSLNESYVEKCMICRSTNEEKKWTCRECWITNDEHLTTCMACSAANPDTVHREMTNSSYNDYYDREWKCDNCWIMNKSDDNKCAACGGSKPGNKQTNAKQFSEWQSSSDNSLAKLIDEQQKDKWQCSNCLTANNKDKTKCACCDTPQPGISKESENVNIDKGLSIKFGIDWQKQQFKPVKIGAAFDSIRVPETNNMLPVTNKVIPTFMFGIQPKKNTDEDIKGSEKSEASVGTPKFTFGIPSAAPATTATSTIMGTFSFNSSVSTLAPPAPAVIPAPLEQDNPQEVPNISSAIPKEQNILSLPQQPFSSQMFKFNKTELPAPPPYGVLNNQDGNLLNSTLQSQPVAAADPDTKSVKPFSFTSTPTVNSPLNLFAPSNINILKNDPPQQAVSTMGLFHNSPGPSANDSQSKTPSIQSIFKFGNSAPEPVPSLVDQKPKFNFTFGSNAAPPALAPAFPAKPAENTFPYNNNNVFGASTQETPYWPPFNNTPFASLSHTTPRKREPFVFEESTAPAYSGGSPAPVLEHNVQHNVQHNLFATPTKNENNNQVSSSPIFGAIANQMPMFGAPPRQATPMLFNNASPAPSQAPVAAVAPFGVPNQMPFDGNSMASTLTPPANPFFAAPQTNGFFMGQQTPPQAQAPGIYNFGSGASSGITPLQFNMGSSPANRKMKKATRRSAR